MIFRICKQGDRVFHQRNIVQLQCSDRGNSALKVSFHATYYDDIGRPQQLGLLRIGMRGMTSGAVADFLPQEFSSLPKQFFSLGQDEYYYENINRLKTEIRTKLLEALQDIAYMPQILKDNQNEATLKHAMIRDIAASETAAFSKIRGQLHRMACGSARLTEYSFSYTAPQPDEKCYPAPTLNFYVQPESTPPTNIHALIGRNGCGKTHLIRNMVRCLQHTSDEYGEIRNLNEGQDGTEASNIFVNILCIAFSPFDDFSKLTFRDAQLPVTFIGLNKKSRNLQTRIWNDFWSHFKNCLITARKKHLWQDAIETLKSDPIFARAGVDDFTNGTSDYPQTDIPVKKRTHIRSVFNSLSAGHKIVLLIITSCVAEIEERSILFLDEPETHLHPPLLSALIRALSDLLRDRNGVAIVATHSPVVLQEIPKNCVWQLTRNAPTYVKAEQLPRETYGTSLGTLIDDVFGLEARNSGFHKMMVEASERYDSYEDVLAEYDGQIGNEAGFLLRMLMRKNQRKGQ